MKYIKYGALITVVLSTSLENRGMDSGEHVVHATHIVRLTDLSAGTTPTQQGGSSRLDSTTNRTALLVSPPVLAGEDDQETGSLSAGPSGSANVGSSMSAEERAIQDDPQLGELRKALEEQTKRLEAAKARRAEAQKALDDAQVIRNEADKLALQLAAIRAAADAEEAAVEEIGAQATALQIQANIDKRVEVVREETKKSNAHNPAQYSSNDAEHLAQRASDAVFGKHSDAVRTAVTDAAKAIRGGFKRIFGGRQ